MPDVDIAQLVRDALLAAGCTPGQIGSFDGHSTIELEFSNLPAVNVSMIEQDVWLWAHVAELTPAIRASAAEPLLNFLMKGFGAARTQQLQLTDVEGVLELRVCLSDNALASPQGMMDALEGFIGAMEELKELLRV
ncbi:MULTISPECIES: Invasion protein B family [Pseudomonas]|uniref:Invasion protein B family n=1 Tax=Pseudomonas quercus TaxID=2722792 RepID=A0ABX0Y8C0_9PSED|nr:MULTISPECIES: Invasion protein B family [Pseudomonas]MBF7141005.1 Invasion protein B family [Pseudomonas sp. LY10J]NJO99539.1 Invasion protein B family [Pseudomonas quercus]